MTSPILVVDGTGLLVRSSRAGRQTGMYADGARTGPLLLFINSLARLIRTHRPTHVLVALDGLQARKWRQQWVPSYKANRPDPPDRESDEYLLATTFCFHAGIQAFGYEGYEADDLIAWAWRMRRLELPSIPMVIASDDADLHQLIEVGVTQDRLSSSRPPQFRDSDWVRLSYGCEPHQLPMLKAVMGDKSDNVPGLPGVGPVKALKLLHQARWVLGNVEHKIFAESTQAEREMMLREDIFNLRNSIHAVWMEPEMDTYPLWADTAWPSLALAHQGTGRLREFLDRYQLASVSERLESGRLW